MHFDSRLFTLGCDINPGQEESIGMQIGDVITVTKNGATIQFEKNKIRYGGVFNESHGVPNSDVLYPILEMDYQGIACSFVHNY